MHCAHRPDCRHYQVRSLIGNMHCCRTDLSTGQHIELSCQSNHRGRWTCTFMRNFVSTIITTVTDSDSYCIPTFSYTRKVSTGDSNPQDFRFVSKVKTTEPTQIFSADAIGSSRRVSSPGRVPFGSFVGQAMSRIPKMVTARLNLSAHSTCLVHIVVRGWWALGINGG